MQTSVEYLGQRIDSVGLHPLKNKVRAIGSTLSTRTNNIFRTTLIL